MSAIKSVALVGASGAVGTAILKKLGASKQFNVKVLQRIGSTSTLPAGTKAVGVDFDSMESLTSAFKGQEAVISTVAGHALGVQKLMIDASIAAGVKLFIPSEFGSNLDAPKTRKIPVFGEKVKIQDYLIEKAKTTDLTYTLVYTSPLLDFGLKMGFLLKTSDYKPMIVEGGNATFSTTTLASMADAVVGILNHPKETKNRVVCVEDIKVSQNQLLAWAKRVAPEKPWSPTYTSLDDLTAAADKRLAQGLFDQETFVSYLYRAVLDPECGGNFEKNDNELLGVKGITEKNVLEILKEVIP